MPELNFNALAQQGPQGVYQGFMQGQQLRNQLAGQEQQRQLGELQLQNALREQRLAGEEEAAYKAAGSDYARLQSELMQRGLGKQALAVGAQQAKMRADQLKMHKDTVELTKTAAQQVMANPQNAAQILSSFGQRYGIDMADDLAQIQQLGGNPDAIRQWAAGVAVQADKLLPKFETMNLGGGVARQGYSPITGAPIAPATFTENVPLPAAVEAQKSRIANAGAARQTTLVNTQLPASEEAQKEFMKEMRQTYSSLKQAPTVLDNIEKAKALVPQAKGFMGAGGESVLQAASFLNNRLGTNINTQGVKSAEELRSRLFLGIMDNLKKLDSQPSQQQQAALQQALGSIGTDPTALPRVLDVFGDTIRQKVDLYNEEAASAEGRGVKFPYKPTIALPPRAGAGASGAGAGAGAVPAGVDPALWSVMTPQERALWQK